MASINYRLKSTANKNVSIYVVLVLGRTGRFMATTGFSINPKDWKNKDVNTKSQFGFPKNINDAVIKNTRNSLYKLEAHLVKQTNKASSDGIIIDSNWLKTEINNCFNRTTVEEIKEIKKKEKQNILTQYIQHFIEISHTREQKDGTIGVKKSTIEGYKRLLHVIELYEKYTKSKLSLTDLSPKFEKEFKHWMLDEKKYKPSYTGKTIARLLTVIKHALYEEIEVHPHAQNMRVIKESKKIKDPTLSFAELDIIENLKIEDERLNNSRKFLILGCFTGLRYSDLVKINENSIKYENGLYKIEDKNIKTSINVTIPILEQAERVIKSGLPYKINAQQLNKDIKDICELAKINEQTEGYKEQKIKIEKEKERRKVLGKYPKYELITTHTFRRSFASNFYKHIPTPIIMEITGHKKESSFLLYIGKPKDKDENAKLMLKYVQEMKQKKSEQSETPIKQINSASNL